MNHLIKILAKRNEDEIDTEEKTSGVIEAVKTAATEKPK
jgi:hypothetical protein